MIRKTSLFVLLLCFLISFQAYGQMKRDTLFYKIKPKMITRAKIGKITTEKTEYFIYVHLEKDYHTTFAQLTGSNIGNFFAVVLGGEIISPSLPVITAKITGGNFSIGSFKKEKNAQKTLQKILKQDKQ